MNNRKTFRQTPQSGAALVVALTITVLIMGLVVGILSRVTTERSSSGGYASSVSARLLADGALQIVQAQISAATSQSGSMTWSSQPGLIRTYDDDGRPGVSYKLYSSAMMQTPGALNGATEAGELPGWFDSPALFTDLNQPADADGDGVPDTWPILSPSGTGEIFPGSGAIEGFTISSAPTGTSMGVDNPAPMPVRWLYVLQDGSMVAPAGSGSEVTVSGASNVNPIVGRIAFWTDDETCKININTASEGMYWDSPRFKTAGEKYMALRQPIKNEFQGYPGHPATVNLSAVFPGLVTGSGTAATAFENIYALTPRVNQGGSLNGTVSVQQSPSPVTLDTDRLYPNAAELIFSATVSGTRSDNPLATTGSDRAALVERAGFFLTACSRAPELTPFGTPKIVCWPLHADNDAAHRSAFDRLIAFCGTLGGQPWYFQRKDKDSATYDYASIKRNQELYAYLQNLLNRKVPGFGGNLAEKFGNDRDQILTEIFDYIRCLNLDDQNIANTANRYSYGNTTNRFGAMEVTPIVIGSGTNVTRGFGHVVTISEFTLWVICTADPTVVSTPSSNNAGNKTLAKVSGTVQLLTTSTVSGTAAKQIRLEAALFFDPFTPMEQAVNFRPDIEILINGLQNWTIRGNQDISDWQANMGFPAEADQTYENAGRYQMGNYPQNTNSMFNQGGYMGFHYTVSGRGIRARNNGELAADTNFTKNASAPQNAGFFNQQYPFVGEPLTVTVSQTNGTLDFSGGLLKVTIRQRVTGSTIQTMEVDFPPVTTPVPVLSSTSGIGIVNHWTFQSRGCGLIGSGTDHSGRMGKNTGGTGIDLPQVSSPTDVARAVTAAVISSGSPQTLDPRLLAMTGSVSSDFFQPHPNYVSARHRAHSMISNSVSGMGGLIRNSAEYVNNKLAHNTVYSLAYAPQPKVPFPADAATVNGDFDNGIGTQADGGFLNASDQGSIYTRRLEGAGFGDAPYFDPQSDNSADFTSPSRMMPSPVMFGSLPVGVKRGLGWQTLLFRRQPAHPSYPAAAGEFTNNPDYLLLDYFWMPVVEPYAISEPLSTAGKINMNHQIIPFTYLERSTGLRAVLKHERVIAVPAGHGNTYKSGEYPDTQYRSAVNLDKTLAQFQMRFTNSDNTGLYAFRTPAEICDIHLVPVYNPASGGAFNPSSSSKAALDTAMAAYWRANSLAGDNSRERIYATLYPRLTTKSNTFTVHYRAQSLKQTPRAADRDKWFENRDTVTGEYRGSTTIERYVNPQAVATDYAANPDASPRLETLYRWRQRENRQFVP